MKLQSRFNFRAGDCLLLFADYKLRSIYKSWFEIHWEKTIARLILEIRVSRQRVLYCKSCPQPEQEENIEDLLCHCIAHNITRTDLLESYNLRCCGYWYKDHPKICGAVKMVLPRGIEGVIPYGITMGQFNGLLSLPLQPKLT